MQIIHLGVTVNIFRLKNDEFKFKNAGEFNGFIHLDHLFHINSFV